jgi:hypothetical protein
MNKRVNRRRGRREKGWRRRRNEGEQKATRGQSEERTAAVACSADREEDVGRRRGGWSCLPLTGFPLVDTDTVPIPPSSSLTSS